MVFHVNPVANIPAIAIDRQRFPCERLRNHQGDEFLRELIRSIVVGAPRDDCRKAVSLYGGQDQNVRGRLARSVRTCWLKRRGLIEGPFRSEAAINFIRADMKKTPNASLSASFHQSPCSFHVRPHKRSPVFNAAVYMALGCKMDHSITASQGFHHGRVADIQPYEMKPWICHCTCEISQIAGVSQLVENGYLPVGMMR